MHFRMAIGISDADGVDVVTLHEIHDFECIRVARVIPVHVDREPRVIDGVRAFVNDGPNAGRTRMYHVRKSLVLGVPGRVGGHHVTVHRVTAQTRHPLAPKSRHGPVGRTFPQFDVLHVIRKLHVLQSLWVGVVRAVLPRADGAPEALTQQHVTVVARVLDPSEGQLLVVVHASDADRLCFRRGKRGNKQARENGDDRDDHQ